MTAPKFHIAATSKSNLECTNCMYRSVEVEIISNEDRSLRKTYGRKIL